MPELPEVENILQGVFPLVKDKRIQKVYPQVDKLSFLKEIEGETILTPYRYGKYLIFPLKSGRDIVFQFRMTGKLVIRKDITPLRHDLCIFEINGKYLSFNSIRKFATIEVFLFSPEKKNLGPDALSDRFTAAYLEETLSRSRMPIKTFLLNQKKIAGLGNIYVCEVLFAAGISPERISNTLTSREAEILQREIKAILKKAIAEGGTTFSDYRKADDTKGNYQTYLQVFKREGLPCFKCASPIKRIKQGGRSTFYCPKCQK
jgi:formamidopyrimidine-DNA glycosylase